LNLSPKADGTFPQEQQNTLLEIGAWLGLNGEAIYDTHNWIKFGEGGGRGSANIRFTVKGDVLYAIVVSNWPGKEIGIKSLATNFVEGKVKGVSLLGGGKLDFVQDENGLKAQLPATAPCKYAYVLKITGLKMNPPTWTKLGNPILSTALDKAGGR